MNLQNGTFYWPTTLPNPPVYPRLAQDITCEILIIGGGISGAQCAYMLREAGMDVVIVEKNRIGMGSTCANTAFIQYAGEKMAHQLVNSFGEELSLRHLNLCKEAINDMENAAVQMDKDASFTRRDSLYTASQPEDVPKLQKDYEILRRNGFQLDFLTEEQISSRYPFHRPAALYSYGDAEVNPYAFTYGLIGLAHSKGVRVYEQTKMTGRHHEQDAVIYHTDRGHSIRAKQVIIATGYENRKIRAEKNTMLISTYAVVTAPVDPSMLEQQWHNRSLIWETARPYTYMRTTPDNRLIIAGMDENTSYADRRDALQLQKSRRLIEEFYKLFPHIPVETEYEIAAFYGGTHDGLPIIGMYDDFPRCSFLYSYGDSGIVYGMVLAKILRDVLMNGHSPDLALYHQSRPLLQKHPVLIK